MIRSQLEQTWKLKVFLTADRMIIIILILIIMVTRVEKKWLFAHHQDPDSHNTACSFKGPHFIAAFASFCSHCGARSCVGVGANSGADGHLSASLLNEKQPNKTGKKREM